MRPGRRTCILGVALLATLASVDAAHSAPEPVRVYTNADLDRLGPAPGSSPVAATPVASWDEIERFLERQYARIDADRRNDLERRQSERNDVAAEPVYSATTPLWYNWYYWGPWEPDTTAHRASPVPHRSRFGGARPPRRGDGRGRGFRHGHERGEDAFPH